MADFSEVNLDENVEESTGAFVLVTPGKYKAVIVKDALSDNKAKTGKVWKIKTQITEGRFANETIKDYINVSHRTPKVQAIGQGTLKRICNIVGVTYPPTNTDEIIGRPFGIKVVNEDFESNKQKGKMLKSAKIAAYIPLSEVTGEEPQQSPTSTTNTGDEEW